MALPTQLRRLGGVGAGLLAVLAAWLVMGLGARAADMPPPPADPVLAGAPLNATIALSIHDEDHQAVTSITIFDPIHARVRVSGATGTPTGVVGEHFYATSDCTGDRHAYYSRNLADGVAHFETSTYRPAEAHAYSIKATYSGSALYNPVSTCKAVTVEKATARITLAIHDSGHDPVSSVYVDEMLHGRARVTGSLGEATGDVRFVRSSESDCGGGVAFNRRPLRDGTVESIDFSIPARGTEYFRASYLGGPWYKPITSACVAVTAGKAPSTVSFAVHDDDHDVVTDPVPLGTWLHPSVRLSGPTSSPSGWMDLRRFDGTSCTGTPSVLSTVIHGEFHTDVQDWWLRRSVPTDFAWQVHYRGNEAYEAKTSACRVMRWRDTPDYVVQPHLPGHARVVDPVPAGTPVHLFVDLSGDYGKPRGYVEIRSYSDGDCSKGMESSGDLSFLVGGGALDAGSFTRTRATAGERSFRAIFKANLDSPYLSRTLPCVAVTFAAPPATAAPTQPPPTSGPAATPTARPQPAPTAAPGPTAAPSATPAPDASASPATEPTAGPPGPLVSSTPPATEPGATLDPSAPTGPAGPTAFPAGEPTAAPVESNSPGSGGVNPILLLALLVVIFLVVGAFFLGRSRRSTPS